MNRYVFGLEIIWIGCVFRVSAAYPYPNITKEVPELHPHCGHLNVVVPAELQLNKANSSDTEAPFLDLKLSISNGTVSSKIYDKRDDFDFDIVNFPFLDGDVPQRTTYGVYISKLISFP